MLVALTASVAVCSSPSAQATTPGVNERIVATTVGVGGLQSPMKLVVVNEDGSGRKELSLPQKWATAPAWSPGGKFLAYAGYDGELPNVNLNIWVVNFDGTSARQLTSFSSAESSPAWSPDARRLAFTADSKHEIWIINSDGTGATRLRSVGVSASVWSLDFSPDGRKILYALREGSNVVHLHLVNVDGTGDQDLTPTTSSVGYDQASWSPDGRMIVFTLGPAGFDGDIAVMKADGSGIRSLTDKDGSEPSWSPDGKKILYWSKADNAFKVMNADGTNRRVVTSLVAPARGDQSAWRSLDYVDPRLSDVKQVQSKLGPGSIAASYVLSEPSEVSYDLQRQVAGKLDPATHKCFPAEGQTVPSSQACTTYRSVKTGAAPGFGGSNLASVASSGRTPFPAGQYRLVLRASDSVGRLTSASAPIAIS
jgi:dipeptidyl aminopeptidase/acylaminoacyl peptidase